MGGSDDPDWSEVYGRRSSREPKSKAQRRKFQEPSWRVHPDPDDVHWQRIAEYHRQQQYERMRRARKIE